MFRQGYSNVDNIFNLSCLVKLRLAEKNGKLYAVFVYFSFTFDHRQERLKGQVISYWIVNATNRIIIIEQCLQCGTKGENRNF